MKAATVALRDQIREVLRHVQGHSMTTGQVAQEMAPITMTGGCGRYCDGHPGRNPYVIADTWTCNGTTHTWQRHAWSTDVYRHLRAMETKGLVARVHLPDARSVSWTWTGPPAEHVADLEAAWMAS